MQSWSDNGYLVLPGFVQREQIDSMKERAIGIMKGISTTAISVFTTDTQQVKTTDKYFLDSSTEVRCFFEEGAIAADGSLVRDPELCVNKIGHALHEKEPVFERLFATQWILSLLRQLGQREPALTQSMYIIKPPFIGGKVAVHVDSTFLDTDPPSVIGLWVALEAATTENGCLYMLPGSHREVVTRRFKRFGDSVVLEGSSPESFNESNPAWTACPVAAGDLVILHGGVAHMSHANTSAASRHAYSVHSVDMTCQWAETNWIQRPQDSPQVSLQSWLAKTN